MLEQFIWEIVCTVTAAAQILNWKIKGVTFFVYWQKELNLHLSKVRTFFQPLF